MTQALIPVDRAIKPSRYAKVAAHEALMQDGVKKLGGGLGRWVFFHKTPGVSITIDDYDRVHADIAVIAKMGCDLPDLGRRVQRAVHMGISQMTRLPIGEIHVTIAGVKVEKRYSPTEEGASS